MSQNHSNSGQIELDQDQLIFRQIDRYQRIFTRLKENYFQKGKSGHGSKIVTKTNEETVAIQAWLTAVGLKSMVYSLLNEEEKEEIDKITEKTGLNKSSSDAMELVKDSQRLFETTVNALSRKNMIFEEPESLILEDNSTSNDGEVELG